MNDQVSPPAAPPPPPTAPSGGPDPEWVATRVTLAGGNAERAKLLESFDAPDKLFERLTAEPAKPDPNAWRSMMAGDDPAELKELERYSDPIQARKAWKEAVKKITAEGRIKVPGENATPEEIAEYTKAIGVPEKVDDYKITAKPVDGYEVNDVDKTFLAGMTNKLHGALAKGAGPNEIVNLAHQLYLDAAADAAVQREERAADAAVDGERINRALWGSKYDQNLDWAIAGAKKFFPGNDEAFNQFMGQKLESGHALFDHPVIQQMFAQVGMEHAEDPFMLAAKSGNKGFDPAKRKEEILAMRNGTAAQRAEYAKLSAPGGELERLNAAMERGKAA